MSPQFGRSEPDSEIRELLRASHGTNVGLRYLDGAFNFDAHAAGSLIEPELAAAIVWLDALVTNPDRSHVNPNLLIWRRTPWLIDHGAALYIHHRWPADDALRGDAPFPALREHVLLGAAADLEAADARLRARVTPELIERILDAVPDALLGGPAGADAGDATAGAATEDPRARGCARTRALPRVSDSATRLRRVRPRRGGRAKPTGGAPARPQGGTPMSAELPVYSFAVLRAVPHVHLGGFSNVGVVLHARTLEFLGMRALTDMDALRSRAPDADVELLARYLRSLEAVCAGDEAAGPVALGPTSERFHWITAPRSDVIQCSPVHEGVAADPERALDELFESFVLGKAARP